MLSNCSPRAAPAQFVLFSGVRERKNCNFLIQFQHIFQVHNHLHACACRLQLGCMHHKSSTLSNAGENSTLLLIAAAPFSFTKSNQETCCDYLAVSISGKLSFLNHACIFACLPASKTLMKNPAAFMSSKYLASVHGSDLTFGLDDIPDVKVALVHQVQVLRTGLSILFMKTMDMAVWGSFETFFIGFNHLCLFQHHHEMITEKTASPRFCIFVGNNIKMWWHDVNIQHSVYQYTLCSCYFTWYLVV